MDNNVQRFIQDLSFPFHHMPWFLQFLCGSAVKSADIRRYIFNKKRKKKKETGKKSNQCILTSTFIVQMLCHLPAKERYPHTHTPLSSFILLKEKVFTPYFYLSQQKSKKEFYYNFVFFSPQKVLFHCDSPPLSIILCPKGGKLLYYYLYFMTNDKMYPLINNMIIIAAVNRDLKRKKQTFLRQEVQGWEISSKIRARDFA